MTETSVDGLIGSSIQQRYCVEALIGRGGMASVYRARDTTLNRPVALKLFRAQASESDDLRRQRSEIELLASLSHPSLVTLFDAGVETDDTESGHGFIVMELIEGENLSKRLTAGALPADHVDAIAAALADALCHIHKAGVIHRDVKPANILLVPSEVPDAAPRVKLADFGIALLVDVPRMTEVGAVLGTANYLSPEQALGQSLTLATDVYSLGLVLLECLTGVRTFPGTAIESATARILRSPTIPPELPGGWASLLAAMTARDPSRRPTTLDIVQLFHRVPHLSEHASEQARSRSANANDVTQQLATEPFNTQPLDATQQFSPARQLDGVDTLELNPGDGVDAGEQTRVLKASPSASSAGSPSTSTAPGEGRRRGPLRYIIAIAIIVVALAGGAVAVSLTGGPPNTAAPSYPSVPGDLGTHLNELQDNIEP